MWLLANSTLATETSTCPCALAEALPVAFGERITSPSLTPMLLAIWPQPSPAARAASTPSRSMLLPSASTMVPPFSAASISAAVGSVMPACARLASASDSAIFTLP